jgi:hypothetical protein
MAASLVRPEKRAHAAQDAAERERQGTRIKHGFSIIYFLPPSDRQ